MSDEEPCVYSSHASSRSSNSMKLSIIDEHKSVKNNSLTITVYSSALQQQQSHITALRYGMHASNTASVMNQAVICFKQSCNAAFNNSLSLYRVTVDFTYFLCAGTCLPVVLGLSFSFLQDVWVFLRVRIRFGRVRVSSHCRQV